MEVEKTPIRNSSTESSQKGKPSPLCSAKRVAIALLAALVGSYILLLVVLAIYVAAFENSLVFVPEKSSACQAAPCTADYCCSYSMGSEVGAQDVTLTMDDGTKLHGWLMENVTASNSSETINMLYSHGSGWNVAVKYRIDRYKFLLEQGDIRIFTYDYPGYGKSGGSADEASVKASARTAADWFTSNFSIPTSDLVYLGRSLGGGVSCDLLRTPKYASPKAMTLQSTFNTMKDAAAVGLPVGGWLVSAVIGIKFDSEEAIAPYSGCLYQSHSDDDEVIPIKLAEELYAAAASVPASCKKWVEVSGLKHDDPLSTKEKAQLSAFLASQR